MTGPLNLFAALILVGCSAAAGPGTTTTLPEPDPAMNSSSTPSSSIPDRLLIDLDDEIVDSVISLASQELDLDMSELRPVIAVAVTWGDDSLNCSRPADSGRDAYVEGSWVVLTDGGQIYDYRAGQDGEFIRCVGGGPPSSTHVGT